jgi:hypothetical protein
MREDIKVDEASAVERVALRNRKLRASIPRDDAAIADPSPEEPSGMEAEAEIRREAKEPPKRKRGQAAGYKETFLKRNEMKTRQCVYISFDIHAVIAKLVRTLVSAGNDISVGGYIDTVLAEHLQANKDEINEVYRQGQGDLL